MKDEIGSLKFLRHLDWHDLLVIAAVVVFAWVLAAALRWLLNHAAERASPHLRLRILRLVPLLRLAVGVGAIAVVVPLLVEPSFQNVVALLATVSFALAFALKDYASSLAAGLVTVLENAYQPGDWIEIDGIYGEVKFIGARAVHVVTPEDNEVIIPHYQFWSKKISNATGGSRSLLCIANFYLHPDHDGAAVCRCLEAVGASNPQRKAESKVSVVAQEEPWGTHYKLKAYVKESREQLAFITELTLRGKEGLRAMDIPFASVPYAPKGAK